MQKEIHLSVSPEVAGQTSLLKRAISGKSGISEQEINHIQILKRSIDARKRNVKIHLRINLFINEQPQEEQFSLPCFPDVSKSQVVIIVGAGPAGLFAALQLIEKGIKPIVLERGKDIRNRRRDLAMLTKHHVVNEDSNYCFGEGGAGTFSDGKLYTRSKKRGDVSKVLHLFVTHGASKDILIDAHPHIGTNKLPKIVQTIRETIINHGGDIFFNQRVTDLIISNGRIKGVKTLQGDCFKANHLILCTGHSARDIFSLLYKKEIVIEAKPFAIGVRVEHPQSIIDQIQYKCKVRGQYLPPASYSIVRQVNQRGVYSFCMCPGGIIAPCATSPGEIVTNGWSPSKRDQATANSGIVVELKLEDFVKFKDYGPLAGMEFQKVIEKKAWKVGGESQKAPAQNLNDFIDGKLSAKIDHSSYIPGVTPSDLKEVLPEFIYHHLREGLLKIGKSMRGYLSNDAVVHAPESRTSSPIRIPRDPNSLEHPQVAGLYPCGEGAGYAGGIISAAIDGQKCADKCVDSLLQLRSF